METIRKVKLGTLITPAKVQKCEDGEYPVLSMTMHNGLVFQSDKFKKSIASQDKSTYKIVYRNQLVIGFPIDEGVLATQRITDTGIVSPAYGIWDVEQEKIDPEFLEYALRCDRAINYYKAKLRGSTARRRSLPTPTLLEFEVPLPTLKQQREILTLIRHVENARNNRQQQLSALDDLVKARFVEMFGEPIKNTMGWTQVLLREVTTKIGSGATPKGGKESYQISGVSLIRSMNVHDGNFLYKDLAHLTNEQAFQLDGVTIEKRDVLVNITGASVARSCVVPDNVLPARVNQHVAIIRCNQRVLNPIFANRMFISNEFKKILLEIGESGGATRQAITKKQLEDLLIILPPIELQNDFAAFVEEVDKSRVEVQKALDQTQMLFDSLMQQYFG